MEFVKRIEKICEEHKKVALFVDMDGTIVEYKIYQDGFITTESKGLFVNLPPVKVIIDKLEELNKIPNLDIFILSMSRSNIIKEEKKEWLKKYAPFIKESNYIILVRENGDYNNDTRNYIKVNTMKEKLNVYDYVMLLDDEHNILRTAQKELKDKGGVFHISSAMI